LDDNKIFNEAESEHKEGADEDGNMLQEEKDKEIADKKINYMSGLGTSSSGRNNARCNAVGKPGSAERGPRMSITIEESPSAKQIVVVKESEL
jgi:hypothetical protein